MSRITYHGIWCDYHPTEVLKFGDAVGYACQFELIEPTHSMAVRAWKAGGGIVVKHGGRTFHACSNHATRPDARDPARLVDSDEELAMGWNGARNP
jgi:hypothetical protein